MKMILNRTSFLRTRTGRIVALAASLVLVSAALTWSINYAKSNYPKLAAPRQVTPTATTNANRTATRAAGAFDVDQTCTINCGATVPASGTVNTAVSFQGTATATGCATTPTFEWNFGDGSAVSTQQNPSKAYAAGGTYNWTLTTRAGSGATGIDTIVGGYGEGNQALQSPFGVILSIVRDPLGRGLFVVDRLNDTSFIRFINTTAAPVTLAGKTIPAGANRFLAGGGLDPLGDNVKGSLADLGNVSGLGVKPDGNLLYFANSLDAIIRVLNIGTTVTTVGSGSVDVGNVRTFPVSGISLGVNLGQLTVTPGGDLYVCDATPGVNKVFLITASGAGSTFAGNGVTTQETLAFAPGLAVNTPLITPRAVEINAADVYIADTGHGRVIKVTGGNATLVSQFSIGSGAGKVIVAPFDIPPFPSGLAWFSGGLYIAMGNSQNVVRMNGSTPAIVSGAKFVSCEYTTTNCGDGGAVGSMQFSFNGSSSSAQQPIVGMEADANGIYLADQATPNRGRVRFLNFGNSTATVNGVAVGAGNGETIAGNGAMMPFNNSLASSAGIVSPSGVALDPSGNLYFAERTGGRVRFVNRSANPVTLFAGTESAQTVQPGRIITINRDFNTGNTAIEGPVIRTTIDNPQGLFATANGIYLVDSQGGPSVKTNPSDGAVTLNKTRTSLIRFFNTSGANVTFYPNANSPIVIAPGNIGTIAGGGTSPASTAPEGFALSIVMAAASDIAVAADGTMYIADTGDKKVRKIAPATGTSSSLTLPTGAKQYIGLAFDTAGRLYITNFDDSQLLRETAAGSGSFARMDGGGLNSPRDVTVDADGNAFVANSQVSAAAPGANANRIMRVAAAGGAATTIAGGASAGFSGDGGLATSALLNVSPSNPVYTAGQPQKNAPTLTGMVREASSGQIIFADTVNERLRGLSAATTTCTQTGSIIVAGSNPLPTLSGISPNMALTGAGAQTITLTGTGFVPSSVVRWNGADRPTTFVSGTSLTAQIPASDITSAGTAQVTVFNAAPGGGTSGSQSFTITAPNPVPTLTGLSPNSAAEGSPAFTLTVTGSNFVNGSVVRWDSSPRPTNFVSATQLTAQIPAADLAGGAGTAQITVLNPAPGGGASTALSFTITTFNLSPTISGLNPGQANSGGAAFTLTVTGSSFVPNSVVRWNGQDRPTTFGNATQLTAQISAADIASVGTAAITVFTPTPGGGVSGTLNFSITQGANPVPVLTSISPTTTPSGGPAFTLTLIGTNFISSSVVRWNGADRATTFDSATQLRAQITANDIASVGTVSVTVSNPASSGGGGGTSSAQTFTITAAANPAPVLTSLSPGSVISGSAAFTLTLTGTGFIPASQVRVNGTDRATNFINNTTLTIQVSASEVASAGSLSLTVFNPAPGGGLSGAQTLTVSSNNPTPTLASLNPANVGSGGAAFTLTVNGTNFINGSIVRWNGADRVTTFVNSTQVTAQIPATDIATAGQATITVFNPAPGGGTSNAQTFTINNNNPTPTLTSLNPASVGAGGAAFTLTVNGTNFINGSIVRLNGADRVTTFVNATQVTAQIPATDIVAVGQATITVFNPAPGGGTSNAQTFTISAAQNPVPVLTSISPSSVIAGSGAVTVTLTGTGFISASMARVNGNNWQTTFVNSTTLTIQLTATETANPSVLSITLFNPASSGGGGGGTSNAQTFTVNNNNNPTPTLTSVNPNTVTSGSAAFTLTVNGTNFINSSVIRWNGLDRPTMFVSATQLTAQISAADVASASTVAVTVFNPAPGGGASNAVNVTIAPANPAPTVTTLSPSSAVAGGAGFTLTITGTGFIPSSTIRWSGSDRLTNYVNPTTLTISVTAADIANNGTVTVAVFNPAPGGGLSGALNFTIQSGNLVPTLTSLNPTTVNVGGGNLLLTVTGTNFVNASIVRWNGLDRPTTFVSATQLTAQIPAADIATAATIAITVFSPAPGGGTSNALSLPIVQPQNPVPTLTNLNPSSAPSGGAAFTLTVTGTNFVNGSIVRWNNQNRTTTFLSATQLTAAITAADLANVGTVPVTVFNAASSGGGGGGTSNAVNFTVTQAQNPTPVITAISPNPATVGGTAFILNVTGTGFIGGSIVRINNAERGTTFVNSTTLTARMLASDVASVGTSAITVFNPASSGGGGGVSNQVSLTIGNPSPNPTLTQLSASLVTTGTAPFTLTVTGTGFIPASQLRVNGVDRLTAYISPTMLTMDVGANELATQGNLVIMVVNPAPGGGTSNALVLTVASITASVSAASYADNQTAAPDSIVAAFGVNLATGTALATTVPLPTTLNGTTVRIRDAAGNERLAPLFFVAANQVNYLLPAGLVNGAATVTITAGDRRVALGRLQIARVEPGLFSANATGQGLMAALALRVRANGELVYEEIARFNAATASFVPVPLDLGPESDRVFLIAFGTGFRNRNDLANVTATLGNTNLSVLYAGAQGDNVGLDQLNLGPIPRSFVGAGSVNLTLRVEGKPANVVSVTFR